MKEDLIRIIGELEERDIRLLYVCALEFAKAKRMGCDYGKREND